MLGCWMHWLMLLLLLHLLKVVLMLMMMLRRSIIHQRINSLVAADSYYQRQFDDHTRQHNCFLHD